MSLTFHHDGAGDIPRTATHALLHTEERRLLRLKPGAIGRVAIETWCDRMHERLTVHGVAHVCQVNPHTGMIQQIWVVDPAAIP